MDERPRESARASVPAPPAPADFDALYRANVAFVWRTLQRLGVPEATLEDATQNVFLVVHRRLGEFERRASFRTWVFRIAQRVASDARRTIRRKGGLAALPDDLADPGLDPHEHAARAEAIAVLDAMLDQLDDDKRAVFVLADLEGMTNPEIAEALGLNLNTVGSRLRAARERFERALEHHHARRRTR